MCAAALFIHRHQETRMPMTNHRFSPNRQEYGGNKIKSNAQSAEKSQAGLENDNTLQCACICWLSIAACGRKG
jgi:hypothetical protein